MVKPPTFDCNGMKKGAWSKEEDERLKAYVDQYGHSNWRLLPDSAGLVRCGKSCRLRWMNYLKPGLKRGKFTKHEGDLVIKLHNQLGNRWSAISAKLPGRTDNEIKNYYHAHIKKRGRRASIKQELLQESSSSSEISSSITTTHDQEGIKTTIDILNPIADLYSFARAQEDLLSDDLSYVDFHPFPEEEFHDFELFQNANLSNSSEDGSSIGEDMLDMILW